MEVERGGVGGMGGEVTTLTDLNPQPLNQETSVILTQPFRIPPTSDKRRYGFQPECIQLVLKKIIYIAVHIIFTGFLVCMNHQQTK